MEELLDEARAAYKERNDRIANLTDESVDTFYSCLLCQSFAPNHVCVVNPERVGLCGAYNWLDCKASYEINPTGPNQPVPKGMILDPVKGEFSGPNEFIYQHSNQSVERVTFYSIMEAPMTSCGCFECIMVLVPEANGFMIVSREDPSMTPCGMTFSTLAGTAGGGMQTPGMMGMGKYYLTSKKFISGRRRPQAHRLDELLPQGDHGRGAARGLRARGRARPARQDRRRDHLHRRRGAAALPRGEGAPRPDHGPAVLTACPTATRSEPMTPAVEIPKETWPGAVSEVTLGAGAADGGTRASTVTVGGEKTLPFLALRGRQPAPAGARRRGQRRRPATSGRPTLAAAWGGVAGDPPPGRPRPSRPAPT